MASPSEKKLVTAARTGDRQAYGQLIKSHYQRIYAICLGLLASTHDAEDATQETVIKAFQKLPKLRKNDMFGSWIARIAKNLCIDVIRRNQKNREMQKNQMQNQITQNTPGDNHDLEWALKQLPAEWRTPLVMYYFDNRSAKNIADTLDISHSNVCLRLRHARQELHKLLTAPGVKS